MRLSLVFLFCVAAAADDLSVPDNLRTRFFALEQELWSNLEAEQTNEVVTNQADTDLGLMRSFQRFDSEVQAASPNRTLQLEKSWVWDKVSAELAQIDNLYLAFLAFAQRQAQPGNVPAPLQRWLDMVESVLKDPVKSVPKSFKKLDDLILHGNVFRSVSALKDSSPDLCNLQQSPHQLLYNMYNTISITEIKGFAMMQFSWMLLRIYGKGNFSMEADLARKSFEERTAVTLASMKHAMSIAKREMYRCDPVDHEEGETYLQITRFLQGYVENEVDMNPEGTCKENCAFYQLSENHGCFKDQFCARQAPCSGRIINCQYIDSDMWICPATSKSNRRYEWIEYENGRTLGKPGSCMRGTSKVDSWWRYLVYHCSHCFCFCEESLVWSDRFFSMREVLADTTKNKIVTGLRFHKVGRVIHLQINEGTLGPRATVDQTSLSWQPVDRMDVNNASMKEGVDYHTLTYERRAIDLDELEGSAGHVLTGVRFRMIGAHLHFEIRTTPFDFKSGKLFVERSVWTSNDNTDGTEVPRKRLVLENPDIPTRLQSQSHIDSKHDQFVEFTHTDMDLDAAQTAVPFLDAQPVKPTVAVPLTGAGLAHKGAKGSGGFITPKVFTYDYSKHMHVQLPENTEYTIDKDVEFVPGVF